MKKTLLIGLASLLLLFSASGCKFNHENRKALVNGLRQVVKAYAANDTGNAVKAEVEYKAPAGDPKLGCLAINGVAYHWALQARGNWISSR